MDETACLVRLNGVARARGVEKRGEGLTILRFLAQNVCPRKPHVVLLEDFSRSHRQLRGHEVASVGSLGFCWDLSQLDGSHFKIAHRARFSFYQSPVKDSVGQVLPRPPSTRPYLHMATGQVAYPDPMGRALMPKLK